jgi:hypothetical protein
MCLNISNEAFIKRYLGDIIHIGLDSGCYAEMERVYFLRNKKEDTNY